MEKIYKVSQVNNDISVLRKELFEKSEEVEKLKSNDKMKVFLSLEEENQKLQKMFDNLQKESSEFHIQIKNIKDLFDDIKNNNNDKESINLEFVSLNIKYLEITEVNL